MLLRAQTGRNQGWGNRLKERCDLLISLVSPFSPKRHEHAPGEVALLERMISLDCDLVSLGPVGLPRACVQKTRDMQVRTRERDFHSLNLWTRSDNELVDEGTNGDRVRGEEQWQKNTL